MTFIATYIIFLPLFVRFAEERYYCTSFHAFPSLGWGGGGGKQYTTPRGKNLDLRYLLPSRVTTLSLPTLSVPAGRFFEEVCFCFVFVKFEKFERYGKGLRFESIL